MNILTNGYDPGFFERIWLAIVNFFNFIAESIDAFLALTINIDGVIGNFYNNVIAPLPEIVKIIIFLVGIVIIVLGTFSLIKKMFKVVLIVVVVAIIIYFIAR